MEAFQYFFFFFSSRRRHTRSLCDWSSDVCSSDLELGLDHFEGRSWQGLHRHALMTMIAYAFLQHRRLAATARKKKNQRPPASANFARRAPRQDRKSVV